MNKNYLKRLFLRTLQGALIFVFLAAFSVFLSWFIQFRYHANDFNAINEFITTQPEIFWYGALIIFFALLFLTAIFRRPFLVCGVVMAALIIITFAHINKFTLRNEPLLPEDLQLVEEADTLVTYVNISNLLRTILAAICALVAGIMGNFLARQFFPVNKSAPWWVRHSLIPRAAIAVVALLGFLKTTNFIIKDKGNDPNGNYAWLKARFVSWNQTDNYNTNGFLFGFLYNIGKTSTSQPENYSKETIADISKQLKDLETTKNRTKTPLSEVENIIVILSESSYDPELIREFYPYSGNDVTPNLHSITKNHAGGYMFSPGYGGGTANIEFEVFTGLSNYWLGGTPYVDFVSKTPNTPSLASWAKSKNFETTALHSYLGSSYKRNFSLKNEGFDNFITMNEMLNTKTAPNSGYISDWSIYKDALDLLRNNDKKQFLGIITMQNHTPYYELSYAADFQPLNDDNPESSATANSYFNRLHSADAGLGNFISALDALDEKTIVLWFGDHAGGSAINSIRDNENVEISNLAYETPYFIYSNFEVTEQQNPLPTTSPNCLSNTFFNYFNLEKPGLYYLLDNVCSENPILTNNYFANGKSPKNTTSLKDYQLINYDLASGKQFLLH